MPERVRVTDGRRSPPASLLAWVAPIVFAALAKTLHDGLTHDLYHGLPVTQLHSPVSSVLHMEALGVREDAL